MDESTNALVRTKYTRVVVTPVTPKRTTRRSEDDVNRVSKPDIVPVRLGVGLGGRFIITSASKALYPYSRALRVRAGRAAYPSVARSLRACTQQARFPRQPLQRRALPDGLVTVDIVTRPGSTTKNPPLIQPISLSGFSWKRLTVSLLVNVEHAEPAGRWHRSYGCQTSLLAMEVHQSANVDVGNAVAVGKAKRLVADVRSDPLDPAAGHRAQTGVDQRDLPALVRLAVKVHLVLAEIAR